MADDTGIQWTDATWNPVRGCSRVSAVDARNGIGGVQARPHADMDITIRHLAHKKGADPSEWPEDLRVREFPKIEGVK